MNRLHEYGYYRIAAANPVIEVANIPFNLKQIKASITDASSESVQFLAFPELCLTGATCASLFAQSKLQTASNDALFELREFSADYSFPILVGAPLYCGNALLNAAVLFYQGNIVGCIPKKRLSVQDIPYFSIPDDSSVAYAEALGIPILEENTIFYLSNHPAFSFCINVGDFDFSSSDKHQQAALSVFMTAHPYLVGKFEERKTLLTVLSRQWNAAIIAINAGSGESTTHHVYAGDSYLAENGKLLAVSELFSEKSQQTSAILDMEVITNARLQQNKSCPSQNKVSRIFLKSAIAEKDATPLLPKLYAFPFVPNHPEQLERQCREIIQMTVAGLCKRLTHIHAKSSVIGISGGLDSTLALLFLVKAYQDSGRNLREIIGVRMPGFGTGETTYTNSKELMQLLGITEREVSIRDAVLQHLKDISHQPEQKDVTYENAQARERTQILMDIANQTGGIVIGTGDLSELALGFCTYNGDHMSMYSLNASIPKTLIPYLIRSLGREYDNTKLRSVLEAVIETPISPELLPPDGQKIAQKTEELIGPYALHDYVMYHMLRYGFAPKKIFALAEKSFAGTFSSSEIKKWMYLFYQRFFQQQFKRNCLPDALVLGSISVFHTFQMPSDAVATVWLEEIAAIEVPYEKNN